MMKNKMTQTRMMGKKLMGRPSNQLKTAEQQLQDIMNQDKIKRTKTKAVMEDMARWTNIYLTIHQKNKLLDYAAEVNERDEEDIRDINNDADAIQKRIYEGEMAKKHKMIMDRDNEIAVLKAEAEMRK